MRFVTWTSWSVLCNTAVECLLRCKFQQGAVPSKERITRPLGERRGAGRRHRYWLFVAAVLGSRVTLAVEGGGKALQLR